MKHYNQSVQYNLALEASIVPIGSICIFPEEFLQVGLIHIPIKNTPITHVRFVYSNNPEDFGLTETNMFSSN